MRDGAKGGTRTLKGLAPLAPKASASTNSATFALIWSNKGLYRQPGGTKKGQAPETQPLDFIGWPCRIRTCDPLIKSFGKAPDTPGQTCCFIAVTPCHG